MVEDLQIDRYNRSDLKKLISDPSYLDESTYPISPQRAESLINNPRAEDEDILLITARKNGRVIAYRTAMPDHVFHGEKKIRYAWICGSWVHPEWRRKRLATKLFLLLSEAWNKHLTYTNYAPISKRLYDKTQVFEEYCHHDGQRFYIRFNAATILPGHYPWLRSFRGPLRLLDACLNTLLRPFMVSRIDCPQYTSSSWSDLNWAEAQAFFRDTLCARGEKEFEWILKYPWVIDAEEGKGLKGERYFFSWIAHPFRRRLLSFENNGRTNHILISQKDGQLKIPYMDVDEYGWEKAARVILTEAQKCGLSEVDSYQEKLLRHMLSLSKAYITTKKHERKYMVSKHISDDFPKLNSIQVPDGEGDVVFI